MNTTGDARSDRLLDGFPRPTYAEWRTAAERLLGGAPFTDLLTETREGITLQPLYTPADAATLTHLGGQPGFRPFARGTRLLGYRQRAWRVAQELRYPTCAQFGAALRHDLDRGQTAVNLVLDRAARRGDGRGPAVAAPDTAGVPGGTVVDSLDDLDAALAAVDLARTPILCQAGAATLPLAALLVALVRRRGGQPELLRGSVGADPLGDLAAGGGSPAAVTAAYDDAAALLGWTTAHAPRLRVLTASGLPYHDAGGDAVQELAFTVASALHHLRAMQERGYEVATVAPRLQFVFGVGPHFFLEIAKLRAARLIWAEVMAACGGDAAAQAMRIHARTGRCNKTRYDRHVNIVRGSTEAMAAIFGGVDSLCVAPYDELLGPPSERSRRLARNSQLILREEAHFDAVVDPAGGSWYVESLTAALAQRAWALLQETEAAGGQLEALREELPQSAVAATVAARAADVASLREVVVGVNRYPDAGETLPGARPAVPDATVPSAPAAGPAGDAAATDPPDGSAAAGLPGDRFARAVAAALDGKPLDALATSAPRPTAAEPPFTPLRPWRAAAAFESLRDAVARLRQKRPDGCTVYSANLGDPARYMPRLDFTREFLEIGGFAVRADGAHDSAARAAAAARASGAPVVVIVGRDETYAAQAAETARLLKKGDAPPLVVLAGRPEEQAAQLRAAGVDRMITAGSDALAVLREIAAACGVKP